jgi:hypothetical protein
MFKQHEDHWQLLEQCLDKLHAVDDIRARNTLWKFYNNCRKVWTEMDKEFVVCRRHNRITPKYTELEAKLRECVSEFDQWITMAALIY